MDRIIFRIYFLFEYHIRNHHGRQRSKSHPVAIIACGPDMVFPWYFTNKWQPVYKRIKLWRPAFRNFINVKILWNIKLCCAKLSNNEVWATLGLMCVLKFYRYGHLQLRYIGNSKWIYQWFICIFKYASWEALVMIYASKRAMVFSWSAMSGSVFSMPIEAKLSGLCLLYWSSFAYRMSFQSFYRLLCNYCATLRKSASRM